MLQDYTSIFYHDFTSTFDTKKFEQNVYNDGNISQDVQGLTIDTYRYKSQTQAPEGHNSSRETSFLFSKSSKDPESQRQLLDDPMDRPANGMPVLNLPVGESSMILQSEIRDLSSHYVKWLTLLQDSYLNTEGEFIYESCISARQILSPEMIPIIYQKRIRNIYEDYRICCSGLTLYDEENMMTIQILLTNDWIYGYYEKNSSYPNHAAFTSIIPLCKRSDRREGSSLKDFVIVGIGIDSYRGVLKFYVNREEIFCVPRIGHRLSDQYQVSERGGISYSVTSKRYRLGFGHFSFLDHHLPNNYSRQHVIESLNSSGYPLYRLASSLAQLFPTEQYREPYPNFNGEYDTIDPSVSFAYTGDDPKYFAFGQGMITRIKYITGYVVKTKIIDSRVDVGINKPLSTKNKVSPCKNKDTTSNDESVPNEDSIRKLLDRQSDHHLPPSQSLVPLYRDKKSNLDRSSKSSLGLLYRKSQQK